MPAGSEVTVTGSQQYGFYPVTYRGTSGWAYGTYLSISGGNAPAQPANDSAASPAGTATTTDALNLRDGPSLGANVLTVMPAGATVALTGASQSGYTAVSYQGRAGWAASAYLTSGSGTVAAAAPSPATAGSSWTTTSALNLRAGPSTATAVLTVMPAGSEVTVTGGAQGGFYPVTYRGTSGWASGSYLKQGGAASSSGSGSSAWGAASSYSTQQIIDIIYAAADKYAQSRDDMLWVARCESGLNPAAVGAGYYGLFQFAKSTWAQTPFAGEDIFDPVASANATGWMWANGQRGQWSC